MPFYPGRQKGTKRPEAFVSKEGIGISHHDARFPFASLRSKAQAASMQLGIYGALSDCGDTQDCAIQSTEDQVTPQTETKRRRARVGRQCSDQRQEAV